MLDGPGHTEADVQVRRDGHAGLPDLELSGVVTRVHNVAGDTNGTAEGIGKRFHDVRKTFSGSDAAAASDDYFGLGEVGAVAAFGGRKSSDHGFCRVGVRQFQRNEFTCSGFGGSINPAGAQGVDGTVAAGGCGDGNSVAKDGHGGGAVGVHTNHVVERTRDETSGEATCDFIPSNARSDEQRRWVGTGEDGQGVGSRDDHAGVCGGGLGGNDLCGTPFGKLRGEGCGSSGGSHYNSADHAKGASGGDEFGGYWVKFTVRVLDQNVSKGHGVFLQNQTNGTQMNFSAARKSAMTVAASPWSTTIWPWLRSGRVSAL